MTIEVPLTNEGGRAAQIFGQLGDLVGSISRLIAGSASMIVSTTSAGEMPCVRARTAIWSSTSGVRT